MTTGWIEKVEYMEKLQDFVKKYGKVVIEQLQLMPDGLAHFEPWMTGQRESYASAEAAYIMGYLYRKEHDPIYLENFSGLLKRSISLLKKKNAHMISFAKVFIFHYSIISLLILPDKERRKYIDFYKNELVAFKDECYAINTNCAALQYGNEIFLSCMNPKRKNILYLDRILNHLEKSQNDFGFINDSCMEGEQPTDGMPIAYHMFCCYLLLEVLVVDKAYHILPLEHRKKINKIIISGIKWLSYATYDVGSVAMAERSRYQVFTMGIQAALVAVSTPKQVERVLEQFLDQYDFNENGSYSTPNSFSSSIRVGFERYTSTNDYNNLNAIGFITADLCMDAGILLFQNENERKKGLFIDEDSGYAFYRNQHGFMGIALRNHEEGYVVQGNGFHYRLNDCLLPLADPRDNVANKVSEAIKVKEKSGGGVYWLCNKKNALIKEIDNGVQIQYENDFFEINKRISITHKSMEWNYHVTINNEKKLSEYEISLFVPLVVNDGRSALKVITEIGQGIIFQWHDLLYVLKYNHAVRAVFDTNLSLGSTSGVSSNYEIILPPPNGNSNHIECSIQLFLIKKEEINNYKCCEDEYAENGYFIDVVAGITGDCVGCGVCASLCPQKCITMQTDDAGFRYPIVDKNRCVGCNICNHRCPINHRPVVNAYTRPFVYAAYASDEENRKASSSGGVFGEFAKIMIENGGTVFAARYHPFPAVTFSKVNDIKSIQLFHGSKYVESKLDNIFAEVQKELNTGKNVLFVGLPCQIAGLLCFLQETYMNLYTIDLICGGVPSSLHFETWIHTLETLYQDQIIDYQFRNKTLGWHDNISSLTFSSGKKQFIEKKKDIFYQDYYKGNNVRKACFHCQFYGLKTVADITIGDFNGALNYDWLRKDADKGISVICINSEKGDRLVQLCKEKMVLRETNFLVASRYNHRMKKRRIEPCEREKYLKDIDLFKKRINSDFNPNALCFYKIENPPERVSKGTVMRWIVYVKGTKEIEYAWYLYHNGDRIHIAWYNEKNSFEYIPETDGEYYVVAFARYKGDQDTIFINLQKVMVI